MRHLSCRVTSSTHIAEIDRRRGRAPHGAAGAHGAAVEHGDERAVLELDAHVVEPGATLQPAFLGRRPQPRAARDRAQEVDARRRRERGLVVAPRRERHRRVGERERHAAVTDVVAVAHVGPHDHRHHRPPRAGVDELDPERLRRHVTAVQLGDDRGRIDRADWSAASTAGPVTASVPMTRAYEPSASSVDPAVTASSHATAVGVSSATFL